MTLSLVTNLSSIVAIRNVRATQDGLSSSINRLSSGLRINRASDDAAGLAISSKLSADLRGIAQAQRNINDGVSMLQTAEGGLSLLHTLLIRMRELAVAASNGGTLGDSERQNLNAEYSELILELDRIVQVTRFNDQGLIDGSLSAVELQVGAFNTSEDLMAISLTASGAADLGITGSDIATMPAALNALDIVQNAILTVSSRRADLGAILSRLEAGRANVDAMYLQLSAANSRILDADVATETAQASAKQILLQAGISVLAQANQSPSVALALLNQG